MALVKKTRTVHTFAELWHASDCLFKAGQAEPIGSTWQFLSSIIMTAFALEAYLNHLGVAVVEGWETHDRERPEEKLGVVCTALGVTLDYSRRPTQTIRRLYKFRNGLAHARTEHLQNKRPDYRPVENVDKYLGEPLQTEWQKLCSDSEFAERVRQDVHQIATTLRGKIPSAFPSIDSHGFGIGMAHIPDPWIIPDGA